MFTAQLKDNLLKYRYPLFVLILLLIVTPVVVLLSDKLLVSNAKVLQLSLALANKENELTSLKKEDQYKINQALKSEIDKIHSAYAKAANSYEKLVDFEAQNKTNPKMDQDFANILKLLSDKNYASASAALEGLNKQIDEQVQKNAPVVATQPAASSNTPPQTGYSRQSVQTDSGTFAVDIIAADLGSTKVIVDTASDSDCANNCPVLPLAEYVSRSGATAGINGSFFCPGEYPSCAGKTNSFDTLLMNKNKKYFNSDNNVYSTIPAAIFSSGGARFVGRSLDWGRDTSVDAVIANYPLLVSGDRLVYSGSANEPKFGGKGARSFIAAKGNSVYIGVVYNATMVDSAKVMQALGMRDAMNLDEGGSTALWYGGYKAGPGRNIPNAVLFVRR